MRPVRGEGRQQHKDQLLSGDPSLLQLEVWERLHDGMQEVNLCKVERYIFLLNL